MTDQQYICTIYRKHVKKRNKIVEKQLIKLVTAFICTEVDAYNDSGQVLRQSIRIYH